MNIFLCIRDSIETTSIIKLARDEFHSTWKNTIVIVIDHGVLQWKSNAKYKGKSFEYLEMFVADETYQSFKLIFVRQKAVTTAARINGGDIILIENLVSTSRSIKTSSVMCGYETNIIILRSSSGQSDISYDSHPTLFLRVHCISKWARQKYPLLYIR
jgi:hypothetical protein